MTALLLLARKDSRRLPAIDLSNQTRIDPTKTNGIRSRFERETVRRLRAVQLGVRDYILSPATLRPIENAATYDYPDSPDKVEKFMRYLRRLQDKDFLEIQKGVPTKSGRKRWSDVYLQSSYQKGLANAYGQVRKAGVTVEQRWIDSAFFRPIHADRAGLIYTRAYSELEGITTAIDTKLSGVLAQGMIEGRGVMSIARDMTDAIESIGIVRARRIARTEVIRAHAEATLNSYEESEIEGVNLLSEFSSIDDNARCPICAKLEGKQYTVSEARGVIPVHPNCRCGWTPVVKDPMKSRRLG
jgi:SPP1 gp7 family putative phage head morphogenesis protein